MAFPTTSVIDNFNRSSLGSNWNVLAGSVVIESNTVLRGATADTANLAEYTASQFGPDIEVYATYTGTPTVLVMAYGRFNATNVQGYGVQPRYSESSLTLWRADSPESWTQLGATESVSWAAGDKFGMEIVGATLKMYRCPSGGNWAQVGSDRTDATYGNAGSFILEMYGTADQLDDFGGGTLVTPIIKLKRNFDRLRPLLVR